MRARSPGSLAAIPTPASTELLAKVCKLPLRSSRACGLVELRSREVLSAAPAGGSNKARRGGGAAPRRGGNARAVLGHARWAHTNRRATRAGGTGPPRALRGRALPRLRRKGRRCGNNAPRASKTRTPRVARVLAQGRPGSGAGRGRARGVMRPLEAGASGPNSCLRVLFGLAWIRRPHFASHHEVVKGRRGVPEHVPVPKRSRGRRSRGPQEG